MIHVEKKVETPEVKQPKLESKKVETPVKADVSKPIQTQKKVVTEEDSYNGLHAYAVVIQKKEKVSNTVQQTAIVTARTEATAKNRLQKEYPNVYIISIKAIADEKGHEILKRVKNKAGIFFDDKFC